MILVLNRDRVIYSVNSNLKSRYKKAAVIRIIEIIINILDSKYKLKEQKSKRKAIKEYTRVY